MGIRVQGERIVVRQDKKKNKTDGGIYLGDNNDNSKPSSGEILHIGNGNTVSSKLNVGDRVMFDQYAGIKLDIDGEEVKVLNYTDVLMVL